MAKTNEMRQAIDDAAEILGGTVDVPEGFTPVEFKPALSKKGESIVGTFDGLASDSIIKGKVVKNYKVTDSRGVTHLVRGTAQLTQFFDTVREGQQVWIKRIEQVDGGQGRVNQYQFAVKRD